MNFLDSSIECRNILKAKHKEDRLSAEAATPDNTAAEASNMKCGKSCSTAANQGFQPAVWGPGLWLFLHTISFNYPEVPSSVDKGNMLRFLKSLSEVLPCKTCSDHFKRHLSQDMDASVLSSRETFSKWLFDFHNKVNARLGKSTQYDFGNISGMYELFSSRAPPMVADIYVTGPSK